MGGIFFSSYLSFYNSFILFETLILLIAFQPWVFEFDISREYIRGYQLP